MEKAYLKKLWWEIVITIVIFSIVPLLVLGAVGYRQFSASYTAKITENLKTLAENRQGALDLFLEERGAHLVTRAGTHSLDRLKNEDYLNKVFNIIESRSR